MTKIADKGNYQIRALDRALDVLESFSANQPELGISDLATSTGIPKPTIVRLLSVLADRGYVERATQTERYRIGVRALALGSVYLRGTSMEKEAEPIMSELVKSTNQTANLAVLQGYEVVHVQVVAPDRPVRFWASVGTREEAYYCGLGKVLLAELDDASLEKYLRQEREARTPNTLTSADALGRELNRVRNSGFALDDEESNLGVRCIAAAVRNGTGEAIAAISISGRKEEFEKSQIEHMARLVVAAADKISARLGAG